MAGERPSHTCNQSILVVRRQQRACRGRHTPAVREAVWSGHQAGLCKVAVGLPHSCSHPMMCLKIGSSGHCWALGLGISVTQGLHQQSPLSAQKQKRGRRLSWLQEVSFADWHQSLRKSQLGCTACGPDNQQTCTGWGGAGAHLCSGSSIELWQAAGKEGRGKVAHPGSSWQAHVRRQQLQEAQEGCCYPQAAPCGRHSRAG